VHARAGVAHAVGAPQADDFGIGGAGALSGELPLTPIVSAQAEVGSILLSPNDAPAGKPARSLGTVTFLMLGGRLHPLKSLAPGGLWIGLGAGLAFTGSKPRFGGGASLGWDVVLGTGRWTVGPFVSYTHVVEPGTSKVSDSDAHVLWGGVQVSFGAPKEKEAAPPPEPIQDGDGDGVRDQDDACPTVKGVATSDINTNGCAADDSDGDGIRDAEDACPQSKGIRRPDPTTNGCPATTPKANPDRDGDGVPDATDACPDEAGKPSDDPKTNGCVAPATPPESIELD